MKKLTVTAAALIAALNVYAQGTVDVDNFGATSGITFEDTGAQVALADGIVAQIYWSATMDGTYAAAGAPAMVGSAFGNPFPGYFGQGVVTLPDVTPAGGPVFLEVRAWELSYGGTYEDAAAAAAMGGREAFLGVSDVFESDTGNPAAQPPDLPPSLSALIPNFTVSAVIPEPSVVALGLLGAGALLLLRRRK